MSITYLRNRLFNAIHPRGYERTTAKQAKTANTYTRKLAINNPTIAGISRAYRRGVAQTGFTIRSKTGISDFDSEFNRLISKWGRKSKGLSNCDITGRTHFTEFQRIVIDEFAVKTGGVLVAHHYSKNFPYGYKYELIPLDLIDQTTVSTADNEINGIRYNKKGEITHIRLYDGYDKRESRWISYKNLTLLVNRWADPVQNTPLAPITAIMEALEYIDNYKSNEMEGAGFRAKTPIIIKTRYFSELLKSIKTTTIDAFEAIKYAFSQRRLDKKEMQGGFAYIDDTEDVIETGRNVDSIYSDMFINEGRLIASGSGLSSSTVIGEKSPSYNAALKESKIEELEFDIVFEDVVEGLFREMIEERLLIGLMFYAKKLKAPNFLDNPELYKNVVFTRKELGHIDPTKTARSLNDDISNNKTKTIQQALEEKGIDYDDYLKEVLEHEMKMLEIKKKIKEKYDEAGIEYKEQQ